MRWRDWFRRRPPVMRVAPLEPRHAARLAAIHGSAFARPWSPDDFEAFLAERPIRADGLFLDRAAQPCGFVISRRVADEAEILSVAVAPEARGRGYARALLADHLQGLAHAGVRTVHLEVENGNESALSLYRRLGFAKVGEREGYYVRPDGTRASALSMSLAL
ncbi:MAG TPA: GNAT family N-acetyltransferase [Beijerinckiaceae bacterium]|nr:GNAT family N-acetyltransferase [Beijerinckiaceae bacterium]